MKSAAQKQKARQQREAGQRASAARKWAAAIAAFERAITLDPDDAQSWLYLAHARTHSGNDAEALIAAERSFALDQRDILTCRLLADIHTSAGRFTQACEVYQALDPATTRDHDFWAEYGNVLWIAKRPREAVDALAEKVRAAGGVLFAEPEEMGGWMYGLGFVDPDGHRWNQVYLDWERRPR